MARSRIPQVARFRRSRPATESMKRWPDVRVAVVGLGAWGKKLVRVFDSVARVDVCVNRTSIANQDWLANDYPQIRATFDLDEAFGEEVDAVVVATPPETHAAIAEAALSAGRHVYLEKPMSLNVSDATRLVESAGSGELVLFVGHTFLFHDVFRHLLEATEEDPIEEVDSEWLRPEVGGGDLVFDLLVHEVALAAALLRVPADGLAASVVSHARHDSETHEIAVGLGVVGDRPRWTSQIKRGASVKRKLMHVSSIGGTRFTWEGDSLSARTAGGSEVWRNRTEPLVWGASTFLGACNGETLPVHLKPAFAAGCISVLQEIDRQRQLRT